MKFCLSLFQMETIFFPFDKAFPMALHLDFLDSPCIYQTQQTNQTEYYASRILLLPEAPYQQCLVQTVLYTDNTSSTTTREQKTLLTLMGTLHMHTMNCVKWKFLVRNN